jgi:hypothetical protein
LCLPPRDRQIHRPPRWWPFDRPDADDHRNLRERLLCIVITEGHDDERRQAVWALANTR